MISRLFLILLVALVGCEPASRERPRTVSVTERAIVKERLQMVDPAVPLRQSPSGRVVARDGGAWETLLWSNAHASDLDGNGSILAPFASHLQPPVDAVGEEGAALMLAIGEYEGFRAVGKKLNIYGMSGAQGAPDANIEIERGPETAVGVAIELVDTYLRLENVALHDNLDASIRMSGTGSLFAYNVSFYINDVIQEVGSVYDVRISSDGLEASDVGNVTCHTLGAKHVTFQRPITLTGTLASFESCDVQEDITFTGAPGLVVADLFSVNQMKAHGVSIVNGTLYVADAPTVQVAVVVPAFLVAGSAEIAAHVPGAAVGDTFAVTVVAGTLAAGTMLGATRFNNPDDIFVSVLAVAAAATQNVTLAITRFAAKTP